jgi:predicted metal-dependent phosphoesterase TrpH
MALADLHLHTKHSDGVRTSFEVLDLAASFGISLVALSDHDNVAAYFEAKEYAASKGIRLVPAVELSTDFRGQDVHILAYDFDPESEAITAKLDEFRHRRESRGERIVERLSELGHPISLDRVTELCGGGSLGRPHIARALVECGSVRSIDEAFDTLLCPGMPGYVDTPRIPAREAIELVREADGFTSVAHATLYDDHQALVDELIEAGLDGIEVFHPDIDEDNARYYRRLAVAKGLVITGGSDDHGFEEARHLGRVMLPEPHVEKLVARLRR